MKPLPFSMMPRTRSRKCVSGSSEPIHCARLQGSLERLDLERLRFHLLL